MEIHSHVLRVNHVIIEHACAQYRR